MKLYNIFNINKYYNDNVIQSSKESFIKSKLNELIMKISPIKDELKEENEEKKIKKKKIYKKITHLLIFLQINKEIIDAFHFSISSKNQLILEGKYGQGKISAIEYYAK